MYADDTQLYISFNPDDQYLCIMLCNKVTECINKMKKWFSINYLKLNEDKTKSVLFSKNSKNDTQLYISFNLDDQYLCTMLCNKVTKCINEMKK